MNAVFRSINDSVQIISMISILLAGSKCPSFLKLNVSKSKSLHWANVRFVRKVIQYQQFVIIGGGLNPEFEKPKWILLSFQYIRTGKKEFLNLEFVLTLHIDPQNLKITM